MGLGVCPCRDLESWPFFFLSHYFLVIMRHTALVPHLFLTTMFSPTKASKQCSRQPVTEASNTYKKKPLLFQINIVRHFVRVVGN